jgi:hypothetical protein
MHLLDGTLGAIYVGNIVAAVYVQSSICFSCLTVPSSLYGMTNVQTFIYFKSCERDRWPLRLTVSPSCRSALNYQFDRSKKGCCIMVLIRTWRLESCLTHSWRRVLDSLHLAFVSHALYFYSVTSFDDILALLTPTWFVLIFTFPTYWQLTWLHRSISVCFCFALLSIIFLNWISYRDRYLWQWVSTKHHLL